jgi:hypothetical protein
MAAGLTVLAAAWKTTASRTLPRLRTCIQVMTNAIPATDAAHPTPKRSGLVRTSGRWKSHQTGTRRAVATSGEWRRSRTGSMNPRRPISSPSGPLTTRIRGSTVS